MEIGSARTAPTTAVSWTMNVQCVVNRNLNQKKMKMMKKILSKIVALAVVVFVAAVMLIAGPGEKAKSLFLEWDNNPTNEIVDATCVYWSTNLSIPLTNWVKVGTALGNTNRWPVTNVNIFTGPHYYFVTASNVVGESLPSNIATLPAPPSTLGGLKLLSL